MRVFSVALLVSPVAVAPPPSLSALAIAAPTPFAPFLPFHFQTVVELLGRRIRGAGLEARGKAAVAKQPLHVFLGWGQPARSLLNLFRERAARRRASGVPNLRARRLVCLRAVGSAAPSLAELPEPALAEMSLSRVPRSVLGADLRLARAVAIPSVLRR